MNSDKFSNLIIEPYTYNKYEKYSIYYNVIPGMLNQGNYTSQKKLC